MFFKVLFAVVLCFALTSAIPVIGDVGGSLPSPFEEIDRDISGTLDSVKAQLPTLPHVPLPKVPVPCVPTDIPTVPETPEIPIPEIPAI